MQKALKNQAQNHNGTPLYCIKPDEEVDDVVEEDAVAVESEDGVDEGVNVDHRHADDDSSSKLQL